MIESCYRCGHTWGVTMTPRTHVLCTACATPTPAAGPPATGRTAPPPGGPTCTAAARCGGASIADLKHAAEVAAELWPTLT